MGERRRQAEGRRPRRELRSVPLAALACVLASLLAPTLTAAAEPAKIDILSPAELAVSADEDVTEDVLVRNSGGLPLVVGFEVNGEYAPTVTPKSAEVLAYSVRRITLTFTPTSEGRAVSGELIASGLETAPVGIPFRSSAGKRTPGWIYLVLFGSLAVALALILVRWRRGEYPRRAGLGARIGPANWDFGKSWGSNLTVIGALLGTIVSSSALPDGASLPKSTYVGLNFFFAALVVIGPFVYTATQSPKPCDKAKTVQEPQFQGYVWSFLLATGITLWAVLGELGTIFAVFDEIRVGQTMPGAALATLGALLAACAVLLLRMTWSRTRTIVEFQTDREAQQRLHLAKNPQLREAGFASASEEGAAVEPELPSWPVL